LSAMQLVSKHATIRIGPDQFYILVSPDQSSGKAESVIARKYRDVTGCSVGKNHSEYLCIVCRENNQSICYCVKTEDPEMTFMMTQQLQETIKSNLKALQISRVSVCSSCPMQAFHTLCKHLEGMDDAAINSAILAKFQQLSQERQNENLHFSAINDMTSEIPRQNEAVMSLLRQHFEGLQRQHSHSDESTAPLRGSLFGNYNKAKNSTRLLPRNQAKEERVG
jgi:hypothetical protein